MKLFSSGNRFFTPSNVVLDRTTAATASDMRGFLYYPSRNSEKFTKPNLTWFPPLWSNCHQEAWFTLPRQMMFGNIKVKRHSFPDHCTKILELASPRCWKGEGLAKSSSIHVHGSSSILCVLRRCSRIQREARFGVVFWGFQDTFQLIWTGILVKTC